MSLNETHLKSIVLLLCLVFSIEAISQTTIASQDFDSLPSGLGYTVSDTDYVEDDAGSGVSSSTSLMFSNDNGSNNRDSDVQFDLIDISSYTDVEITISFASVNVDNNENLELYISYDGGAYAQVAKLIDGQNGGGGEDWDWGQNDNDGGAVSSNPYTFSVPNNGYTTIQIQVQAENLDDNEIFYIDDVLIEGIPSVVEPDINVLGNSNDITDGQVASTTYNTDFGQVITSAGSETNIFTIENTGSDVLNITSISLSGSSDFTLNSSIVSISAGGSQDFTIDFEPTTDGIHSGTIVILSDDSDEASITYYIEGEGVPISYCTPAFVTGTDNYISNVSVGTINNTTTYDVSRYSDFSGSLTTDFVVGSTNTFSITRTNPGTDFNYLRVWIDWNQDGDFDDTDEEVFVSDYWDGTNLTFDVLVPVTAVPGSTRMRVISEEFAFLSNSCAWSILLGEAEDYSVNVIDVVPMIDFDGIDDYVDFGDSHDLTGSFSIEAWILQEQSVTNGTILSKGDLDSSNGSKSYGYVLALENDVVTFKTFNNGGQTTVELSTSPYTITNNKWHHVAVSYNGTNSNLYIDGVLMDTDGTNSSLMNNTESFFIGAFYDSDSANPVNYYDGFIDEVRIWNVGLTQLQIQEMMNQEIEQNGSGVRGKITLKDISNGLDWETNLIGYYDFNDDSATDQSNSGIDGIDMNITTSQLQTAPLPYYTMQNGNWDSVDNTTPWQYRETVWNTPNGVGIDGLTDIDWNIVRISHNVDVNRHLFLGSLISESTALLTDEEITDSELTVGEDGNDYELNIAHYLKLDGKIDLQNESQLIQGSGSWLDTDSSGYVERDQQGTANSYTYNYWSSPVGLRNITENNKEHKLGDVLRDGHQGGDVVGTIDFDPDSTSNIDPYYADGAASDPRKAATYWMYKFVNSQENDYTNWEWVGNYYDINPTEGYTMKGTSGSGNIDMGVESQNYVFRGKPNNVINGETEIVHTTFTASFDANGNPKISLAGNPFLSAIDADAFIDDNVNSINGQIYFWEHWGGGSHRWAQYQGGYSIYTKAGGTPAVAHPDVSQLGSGSKTPERYIPVGQGFYVIQKHDYDSINNVPSNPQGGNVVFNNNQRIFKTEASGESIFTKESIKKIGKSVAIRDTKDKVQRIRIGFTSPDGFYRSNMIAFLEGATDEFDNGYDAVAGDFLKNDGFFIQDGRYQVIQAFGHFDQEREVPITIFIDEEGQGGVQTISLEAIENFENNIEVFIKDNHNNGETFELSSGKFEVNLEPGQHRDRFSIVFQSKLVDLESLTKVDDTVLLYMNNEQEKIQIEKIADIQINNVFLYNSIGQIMNSWGTNLEGREIQLPVNVSSGVYLVSLETEIGLISRKIVIDRIN